MLYLCVSDESVDRSEAFSFLNRLQERFEKNYGRNFVAGKTIPLAINSEFSSVMGAEMRRTNSGAETSSEGHDKIGRLQEEVREVKDIMVSNINELVERGEKLELLVDKTENLATESITFRRTAREVRRVAWWQNVKVKVIVAAVVIVVIYAIISASCGGPAWPKCVGKKK